MSDLTIMQIVDAKHYPVSIMHIPRGEPMPEIDRIITGDVPVSAHGFSGLHEAAKYLSDYSLQLEMTRQVGFRKINPYPSSTFNTLKVTQAT